MASVITVDEFKVLEQLYGLAKLSSKQGRCEFEPQASYPNVLEKRIAEEFERLQIVASGLAAPK